MRIEVSSVPHVPGHPGTTLIIDGVLAIDAGLLGIVQTVQQLTAIKQVLLTHAHMDHVAGLPIFVDTVYGLADEPPTVYASATTLAALRAYIFNDQIMPDFIGMSQRMSPFLATRELQADVSLELPPYRITPFAVDHNVPCLGYVIEQQQVAVAVVTDTLPTDLSFLATWPGLKVVFLEASFPDRHSEVALQSKHHTVSEFLAAARSLPASVRVVPIHIKPQFATEIMATIRQAGVTNVLIPTDGKVEI